jgi:hypothetical protein
VQHLPVARKENAVANVIIKRCPVCPTIKSQAIGIAMNVEQEMGIPVVTEDGEKGELSVFVDGVPVIQRTGDDLPTTDEVEAAVKNALPAAV